MWNLNAEWLPNNSEHSSRLAAIVSKLKTDEVMKTPFEEMVALKIQWFGVHDSATILLLTGAIATFEWSDSSANGGRYFRRLYLNR